MADNEPCNPDQCDDSVDDDSQPGDLQQFYEDDSTLLPEVKTQHLMMLCTAYVPKFSHEEEPFSNKALNLGKRTLKPTLNLCVKEYLRRHPTASGYKNWKLNDFQKKLSDETLPKKDQRFVERRLEEHKECLLEAIKEHQLKTQNPSANDPNAAGGKTPAITTNDRLRLIEAMLSDEAIGHLHASQEVFTRAELDARNSVARVVDYFEAVANVFNQPDFVAITKALPGLHPELDVSRTINLGSYRMDTTKAKEKYHEMKNHLHQIINNWELSGNGDGQRSDVDPDWGRVPEMVDGSNRANFVPNVDKNWHLLCFWCRLEEFNLVQFTLSKLPGWMSANASQFTLVASQRRAQPKGSSSRKEFESNLKLVGNAIKALAHGGTIDRVVALETQISDVEERLVMCENDRLRVVLNKKKRKLEEILEKARQNL